MLKLLFADESGRVYEHPELLALARDGLPLERPSPMPAHATLAALPGRRPLGLDPATGRVVNDVLAVSAMNDWLQASFKLLCAKTNAS